MTAGQLLVLGLSLLAVAVIGAGLLTWDWARSRLDELDAQTWDDWTRGWRA